MGIIRDDSDKRELYMGKGWRRREGFGFEGKYVCEV